MARVPATKPSAPAKPRIASKEQLAALGVHTVTLHGGAQARIRIPDLSLLVAVDAVPEQLRMSALTRVMEEIHGAPPAEMVPETNGSPVDLDESERTIKEFVHLHIWLVSQMFVEPEYTFDELMPGSPVRPSDENMVLLIQLATRGRDTDAAGVKLGIEPLSRWETFRKHHKCRPACAACVATLSDFSTTGLDSLQLQ